MSTANSTQNNEPLPTVRDRKDIIVLSADIECPCGRTKERAHCPVCGKVKLYGRAVTEMAVMPNGDIVKDCKTYRCSGCAEVFNDVAWYFNCHAPKKIDWEATKKALKEKNRKEAEARWLRRIELVSQKKDRLDYNDLTKCKAETGLDVEQLLDGMRVAKAMYDKLTPEQKARVDRQKAIMSGEIEDNSENQAKLNAKLQDHLADCNYCNSHEDMCAKAHIIMNGEIDNE